MTRVVYRTYQSWNLILTAHSPPTCLHPSERLGTRSTPTLLGHERSRLRSLDHVPTRRTKTFPVRLPFWTKLDKPTSLCRHNCWLLPVRRRSGRLWNGMASWPSLGKPVVRSWPTLVEPVWDSGNGLICKRERPTRSSRRSTGTLLGDRMGILKRTLSLRVPRRVPGCASRLSVLD